MFFNKKALVVMGVVDAVLTVALMWAAYAYGHSKGYVNACEHSFFLMSGVNGNLDTNGLEVSCKLLESRRSEAQELLDQAKKMNNQ